MKAAFAWIVLSGGTLGRFEAHRYRMPERALVRLQALDLDRALAAGQPPESSRLLAARAAELAMPASREALARDWERLLARARDGRLPRRPAAPVRAAHLLAAEPELRELLARLRARAPVGARGVAAANLLLTDGTGPLYQRRGAPLADALREVTELLDPLEPLFAGDRP